MSAQGKESRPIVVGVSPTTGSPTALRWAVTEADLHEAPLLAVTAWNPPALSAAAATHPPAVLPMTREELQRRAQGLLEAAVAEALGEDSKVVCRAIRGGMTQVLLRLADEAQLLVLGPPHPNRGAAIALRLRAVQLIGQARCPIVVAPPSLPRAREGR